MWLSRGQRRNDRRVSIPRCLIYTTGVVWCLALILTLSELPLNVHEPAFFVCSDAAENYMTLVSLVAEHQEFASSCYLLPKDKETQDNELPKQ